MRYMNYIVSAVHYKYINYHILNNQEKLSLLVYNF